MSFVLLKVVRGLINSKNPDRNLVYVSGVGVGREGGAIEQEREECKSALANFGRLDTSKSYPKLNGGGEYERFCLYALTGRIRVWGFRGFGDSFEEVFKDRIRLANKLICAFSPHTPRTVLYRTLIPFTFLMGWVGMQLVCTPLQSTQPHSLFKASSNMFSATRILNSPSQ